MANLGPTNLPNSYKSWGLSYKRLIRKNYEKGPDYRQGLFTIESTDKWEERVGEKYTEGDFAVRHDGETAAEGSIKEGYRQNFTQHWFSMKFGYGYLFERFQIKDLKANNDFMRHLGERAYRVQQNMPWSMITYGGFADTNAYLTALTGTSTSSLLPDGKRIFSTAHPVSPENSTTWSNVSATNAVFSEAAYQAGLENLEGGQLDMDGKVIPMGMEGKCVYVPYNKLPEAERILESTLRAGTTDNDKNVYNDGGPLGQTELKAIPSWLMDTTNYPNMWFMTDKGVVKDSSGLQVLDNQSFNTEDYTDTPTKTAYVEGNFITTVGPVCSRGMYGSLGTGTGSYTD